VLQNLMLVIQAMGLGGWIHALRRPAAPAGPIPTSPRRRASASRSKSRNPACWICLRWGTFLTGAARPTQ